MIRFNAKGEFNLPVGNVDFNQNVLYALNNYFNFVAKRKIYFYNQDFRIFLKNLESEILALKNSKIFIYFDPPYLIGAMSIINIGMKNLRYIFMKFYMGLILWRCIGVLVIF